MRMRMRMKMKNENGAKWGLSIKLGGNDEIWGGYSDLSFSKEYLTQFPLFFDRKRGKKKV